MAKLALLRTLSCICLVVSCTTFYRPPIDRQNPPRKSQKVLKPAVRESRDALIKKFLNHIKVYLGTPYQFGGCSREGMDCSGFVSTVFNECFNLELPHNAYQIYDNCQKINKSELTLGDLVFFSNRQTIDHVGIYLVKNYFVHASVSHGVIVSELTEQYYRSRYAAVGRIVALTPIGKRE